jgi:RNA polymerase sigma factor (TIGR02999 family)
VPRIAVTRWLQQNASKYLDFQSVDFDLESGYLLDPPTLIRRQLYVSEPSIQSVTELLANWRAGDQQSFDRLVPLVYDNLRRLAHHHLRRGTPGHTLQTTALVHEAYLRMMKQDPFVNIQSRAHFFAICSHLMRWILVDYARRKKAAKRDGGYKLSLDDALAVAEGRSVDLIALDDALNQLAKLDAQQSRIVELRFFSGLSIEETAEVLGVSPATVKRHWATARLWLHNEIKRSERDDA